MPSNVNEICHILNERTELLRLLADQSLTQQQILERTDASQSTVSRALTRLQELSLATEIDNQYELTLLGKLAFETHESYVTEFEQFFAAEEILQDLPAGTPLDPVMLDEGDVTTSNPYAPDAALAPVLRLTREAIKIKCAATMLHAGYAETFNSRMEESDLEAEFVMTDAVVEQALRADDDPDTNWLSTGRLELYITADDLPYSLLIAETKDGDVYAVMTVSSETGTHGTIVNSNEAACEWAQEQYQRFKADAEPWRPPSEPAD